MSVLTTLFQYINENQDRFVKKLAEWVAIQSVSAWPEKRGEIRRMMEVAAADIKQLGGSVELVDIGMQKLPDGSEIPLPPIVLGTLGSDPQKKTVCVYGHLDVQPAALEDGWDSEPFTLVERDGKLYGRGATDDKGPVAGWMNALEAFQKTNQEIPVNIRFCLEGMEESGSEGLDDLIFARKDTFFKDVDYVCISDNYWLGKKKPCITYGLRGICYFFIEVECSDKDLHSGVYGGSVHEAMTDLITLMVGTDAASQPLSSSIIPSPCHQPLRLLQDPARHPWLHGALSGPTPRITRPFPLGTLCVTCFGLLYVIVATTSSGMVSSLSLASSCEAGCKCCLTHSSVSCVPGWTVAATCEVSVASGLESPQLGGSSFLVGSASTGQCWAVSGSSGKPGAALTVPSPPTLCQRLCLTTGRWRCSPRGCQGS
ncbi:cytosolic non-specific dipeptidase isoform X2 [Rhinolophus sinicus]|uniref:cytosolic non-specific dipeptidase isoform X2 n=1 Tax=Rhinolophus sinicus TaxID=89399 RepID=UPI003D79D788